MNGIVQSISSNIYDVLSIKILQGSDAASGTLLQKRRSRIYGLNPGLMYLEKRSANRALFLTAVLISTKSEVFLKDFFSKFEDIGK